LHSVLGIVEQERGFMVRTRKLAGAALAAALVVGGLTAGSAVASPTTGCSGGTTKTGALSDGAYELQCPAGWNGTLLLYSHGYVTPTVSTPNPATDVGDPLTGAYLLSHGFALAGSSYATKGWAIQQALPDQVNTLTAFDQAFGKPRTTIAWGHSLGGIITAGLIQDYPNLFNAALPMCGVLSGGVATWNTALDAAFAFQQLIDPKVQVVNIGINNAAANLTEGETAVAAAQQTAAGRARLALVAALGDTPGWFTPLSPEPAATDYAAQEQNQFLWDTEVTFPFVLAFRAELEARAGGNVSWNTGVNYFTDLAKSVDLREVTALYKTAGLSLTKDLVTLNSAPRISAKPSAVAYLAKYISFNGDISIPVLSMHTTGDGLVVPENEQAYKSVVDRDGNGNLLRQIFVNRAGHCAFTPAETITAVQTLLNRLSTGHWNVPSPAGLNSEAAALPSTDNVYIRTTTNSDGTSTTTLVPTAPAFISYTPAQYLRPFDLPPALPFS
jgi:pimeloyl-ACP methyl ester carboxylesterase